MPQLSKLYFVTIAPFSLELMRKQKQKNQNIIGILNNDMSLCTSDLLLYAMPLIMVQRHLDAENCVTLTLYPHCCLHLVDFWPLLAKSTVCVTVPFVRVCVFLCECVCVCVCVCVCAPVNVSYLLPCNTDFMSSPVLPCLALNSQVYLYCNYIFL